MSGLLLKDFLILKSYWKTYGLLVAFYVVFSFAGNYSFYSTMMCIILFALPLSSFTTDELARWDKFAAALPGGRRAVVNARYQFLLLVVAGTFLFSCLIGLLLSLFGRGEDTSFPELVLTTLGCTAVGLLMNCVLFPLLFKYGSQKSRILMGIVFGCIFAVLVGGLTMLSLAGGLPDTLSPQLLLPAVVGAVVILIAAVPVSYLVSCRIYERKEF